MKPINIIHRITYTKGSGLLKKVPCLNNKAVFLKIVIFSEGYLNVKVNV
jgi:hypothetical protein